VESTEDKKRHVAEVQHENERFEGANYPEPRKLVHMLDDPIVVNDRF